MKVVPAMCAALTGWLLTFASVLPAGIFADPPEVVLTLKKNQLAGVYEYVVKDVPPEYRAGVLHIRKEGREYLVTVEIPEGMREASEVTVKKNTIHFYLLINAQKVDVTLKVVGDRISGESASPDGVFILQGTRRKA